MNVKADLKSVEDLQKSKGWEILSRIMKDEMVAAAMAIAENPMMTLDEINFRRGTIFAAKQLVDLPSKIKLRLENELALSPKDDKPNSPQS